MVLSLGSLLLDCSVGSTGILWFSKELRVEHVNSIPDVVSRVQELLFFLTPRHIQLFSLRSSLLHWSHLKGSSPSMDFPG